MQADEVRDDEQTADAGETVPLGTAAIAEEAAKLCCICGLDVSQKKRTRDRGGRYWCAFCQEFDADSDKSPGVVPCPDCGRNTRPTMLMERGVEIGGKAAEKGAERVCRSCNQLALDERKNRAAHKAAATADPEIQIRKLIRQLAMSAIGLACLAVIVALYHFGLLYTKPRSWVPFLSALWVIGFLIVGVGVAIAVQYARMGWRKRMREAEYDKMIADAANQILALDDENHSMGISEPPGPLRNRVERAVARVEACAGLNVAGAADILKTVAEKGQAGLIVQFMMSQRPTTNDTVARNREIATVAFLEGDWTASLSAVTSILLRLPHDQDAMTRRAMISYRTGEFEQAKKIFKRVVYIAREKNSDMDIAAAYCNLGMLHMMLEEYDDAAVRYGKAMSIYNRLKYEDGQADCMVNLGLIAYKAKKGKEVEHQFRAALDINKRHKRREGLSICYSLLGVILIEKDNPELNEAEKLLKQAVQLNLDLGRPGGVAAAYGNLGLVHVKRRDFAGARDLFLKAQSIYQRINRPKMVAKIQGMLRQVGGLSAAKA